MPKAFELCTCCTSSAFLRCCPWLFVASKEREECACRDLSTEKGWISSLERLSRSISLLSLSCKYHPAPSAWHTPPLGLSPCLTKLSVTSSSCPLHLLLRCFLSLSQSIPSSLFTPSQHLSLLQLLLPLLFFLSLCSTLISDFKLSCWAQPLSQCFVFRLGLQSIPSVFI